jgi:hypothetical protein
MAYLLPLNQNVNVMNFKTEVVNVNDEKDVEIAQMFNNLFFFKLVFGNDNTNVGS